MNIAENVNIETGTVVGHFINGEVIDDSNRPQPVTNPATGEVSREVCLMFVS